MSNGKEKNSNMGGTQVPAHKPMESSVAEHNLPTDFQKFIHLSRYARWNEADNRRETFQETVNRLVSFWREQFTKKQLPDSTLEVLRQAVLNLEIMPSMRSLMCAGPALSRDNVAGFNCAYVAVDHPRVFDEILYILMCGTGVGFSVERQSISKLPEIADELYSTETTIVVADSKIGWAKAYREFISLLYQGQVPQWDVSKVRPAGARLKTFGGRASGPKPLVDLFRFTEEVFRNAKGRRLQSLEVHDIVCKVAEVVVVGGVRRSALISLSNLTDARMRSAKSGQWWEANKQRALANNSVAYTEKPDIGIFMEEWKGLYDSKSGERGIFNRAAANASIPDRRKELGEQEFGCNPCSEILLRSKQFCNLTECVVRVDDDRASLLRKIELATILGTMQASLTNFRYLSAAWRNNTEEEALLGVSLTGIMDNALTSGSLDNVKDINLGKALKQYGSVGLEETLNELRSKAVQVNSLWSKRLGVNSSMAITCVEEISALAA